MINVEFHYRLDILDRLARKEENEFIYNVHITIKVYLLEPHQIYFYLY